MAKEIERRFLVNEIPSEIHKAERFDIRQGYTKITPEESERVREKGDQFFFTKKTGQGLVRDEEEEEITEEEFEETWPEVIGSVTKTRHNIPRGKRTLELDVFHGRHEGLTTTEVEFDKEGARFTPPKWFGEEITNDPSYTNAQLALAPPQHWDTAKFPYGLEEGVERLIQATHAWLEHHDRIVVYVAGGSASGKTSRVANAIIEEFDGDATMLSLDNYYRGGKWMEEQRAQGNEFNYDQPEVLELELVKEHIGELLAGKQIQRPIYRFEDGGVRTGTLPLDSASVIVVEGLFALNEEIRHEPGFRAFVDIDVHGALIRRLLRDVQRTDWSPGQILQYFSDVVVPMDTKYVQSTRGSADIIIGNPYNPSVEARRSGQYEHQVKFVGELGDNIMRELGAEFVASVRQSDTYLDPHDRNLAQTGESLRIREQGGTFILTYKGPIEDGPFRRRPKFECPIDEGLEESLLNIYGKEYKIVEKSDRRVFLLDGAAVTVDRDVTSNERPLGSFVEIRAKDEAHMREIISKLGFNEDNKITKSYAEM